MTTGRWNVFVNFAAGGLGRLLKTGNSQAPKVKTNSNACFWLFGICSDCAAVKVSSLWASQENWK